MWFVLTFILVFWHQNSKILFNISIDLFSYSQRLCWQWLHIYFDKMKFSIYVSNQHLWAYWTLMSGKKITLNNINDSYIFFFTHWSEIVLIFKEVEWVLACQNRLVVAKRLCQYLSKKQNLIIVYLKAYTINPISPFFFFLICSFFGFSFFYFRLVCLYFFIFLQVFRLIFLVVILSDLPVQKIKMIAVEFKTL